MALIASEPSAVQVITPEAGGHWLKDPADPALTIPLFVTAGPKVNERRRQTAHLPLGASAAVVVKDAAPGITSIQISLYLATDAERVAILSRKQDGRTLLYQDSVGHQWYVQFMPDAPWEPASYAVTDLSMEVEFIKVAKP